MDHALNRRSGRIVLAGTALGAGLGVAYVLVVAPLGFVPLLRGAFVGALIAGGIGAIEILGAATAAGYRLRRLPFAAFIATKTALWLAWIAGVLLAMRWVSPYQGSTRLGGFAADLAYSLAISLALVALIELGRLLGRGVLWRLVTGRYHRPVIEDRAFLLLDLEGSTAIAEEIGDERFLALLDRVIVDVSEDIVAHGGEIYRYVGDSIIVSWPAAAAVRDARILRCLAAVTARMRRGRDAYRAEFGVAPAGRAALHAGPIAVGEVGDVRREIMFLGDTLNTAARIEQECRRLGRRALISGDLLARLALPDGMRVEPLGDVMLRGKGRAVALHALELG